MMNSSLLAFTMLACLLHKSHAIPITAQTIAPLVTGSTSASIQPQGVDLSMRAATGASLVSRGNISSVPKVPSSPKVPKGYNNLVKQYVKHLTLEQLQTRITTLRESLDEYAPGTEEWNSRAILWMVAMKVRVKRYAKEKNPDDNHLQEINGLASAIMEVITGDTKSPEDIIQFGEELLEWIKGILGTKYDPKGKGKAV